MRLTQLRIWQSEGGHGGGQNQSAMDCKAAFAKLDEYLDRELNDEEVAALEAHLCRCKACADEFVFETNLKRCLCEKVRRIQAPEQLRGRVLDALKSCDDSTD